MSDISSDLRLDNRLRECGTYLQELKSVLPEELREGSLPKRQFPFQFPAPCQSE